MTDTASFAVPSAYRVRARNLAPDSDNKIHDDNVAQKFGFSGALVPGVELFAYLSHPFVDAWGAGFFDGGRLEARFRRPVYDGDEVVATGKEATDGAFDATLAGSDGEVRAVGRAWPADGATATSRDYAETPAPAARRPTGPDPLPLGPLGSVEEPVTVERHEAYLDGIGETLPIYRDGGLVHPGAMLRIVNELLMRNVALGPWIHTASSCRYLAAPRLGSTLRAHGVVTECFERNGHHYVRYDALVLSDDVAVMEAAHTAIYRLAGT